MGPRGTACQAIVQKLLEQPANEQIHRIADRYGCADFPALAADRDDRANVIGQDAANELAPAPEGQ